MKLFRLFGEMQDKTATNFVSIVQQNMKLSGNQMIFELKRIELNAQEMKNIAKQLGEKASLSYASAGHHVFGNCPYLCCSGYIRAQGVFDV